MERRPLHYGLSLLASVFALTAAAEENTVTPETFIRAETDRMFCSIAQQAGGVNRFFHFRKVTPLDKQTVVHMNKDTLYSMAVVEYRKGGHHHRAGDAQGAVFLGVSRGQ